MVFQWNDTDPLVINPAIELPQLDIAKNTTEDCTLTYSTGKYHSFFDIYDSISKKFVEETLLNCDGKSVDSALNQKSGWHLADTSDTLVNAPFHS
jgi:hypothetical protein